jgi:hypothetical protein
MPTYKLFISLTVSFLSKIPELTYTEARKTHGRESTALPYWLRMNTIVETRLFSKTVSNLWSESEQEEFFKFIAWNPLVGKVIPGTGRVRKVRWARQGSGKRGGIRVIYYNKTKTETWLLTLYAKNDIPDFSVNELIKMRKEVDE